MNYLIIFLLLLNCNKLVSFSGHNVNICVRCATVVGFGIIVHVFAVPQLVLGPLLEAEVRIVNYHGEVQLQVGAHGAEPGEEVHSLPLHPLEFYFWIPWPRDNCVSRVLSQSHIHCDVVRVGGRAAAKVAWVQFNRIFFLSAQNLAQNQAQVMF